MNSKPSIATRLVSMFVDHIFMSIIAMIVIMPAGLSDMLNFEVTHELRKTLFNTPTLLAIPLGFALYFCKDCLNGRSIAKRMFMLQVVNYQTGEAASPLRCLVRNIFCALWPVEVIITFVSPERRLGDMIAGTRVMVYDPTKKSKSNFKKAFIPLVISYAVLLLFVSGLNNLFKNTIPNFNYIESSYNSDKSILLEDELKSAFPENDVIEVDARVYDKMELSEQTYISVIIRCYYSADYPTSKDYYNRTLEIVHRHYPSGSVVGQVQYIVPSSGAVNQSRYYIQ